MEDIEYVRIREERELAKALVALNEDTPDPREYVANAMSKIDYSTLATMCPATTMTLGFLMYMFVRK